MESANKVAPEPSQDLPSKSFQSWNMESCRIQENDIVRDLSRFRWDSDDIYEDYKQSNDVLYRSFCPYILPGLYTKLSGPECIGLRSFRFQGFCMLADISGFTQLSSQLCAIGAKGLDKLRKIIDGYFKSLVETIYAWGGDGKLMPSIFSLHNLNIASN
jgi:hypothetical protein